MITHKSEREDPSVAGRTIGEQVKVHVWSRSHFSSPGRLAGWLADGVFFHSDLSMGVGGGDL